jgi:DNA-binding IclR family transcriptional regulator
MASPVIERLNRSTKEAVNVRVVRETSSVVVAHYPSSHMLGVSKGVGNGYPSHCTAPGKILLSALPDSELTALFNGLP